MRRRLAELAGLFLKLGTIGFGGPAVHIATMEEEAVQRRGWLSRQHYLDLVGATNLIPGPNSTEIAMHIGYHRAGWVGLVVAGACFIFPAVLITTAFAWVYVSYGQTPAVQPLLAGIQPAVLAIIFTAGWRLARKAIAGWETGAIAVAVAIAAFTFPGREIWALLAGGLVGMLWLAGLRRGGNGSKEKKNNIKHGVWIGLGTAHSLFAVSGSTAAAAATPTSLLMLGLFFLKVGAVLYGSGYVLIAYLEGGLVEHYGWLTHQQLYDAVGIGQLTPGPILSTATFIGYLVMSNPDDPMSGLLGAAVATAGIFLPSFLFVAVLGPIIPKLRSSRYSAAFLDAVNGASIGLLGAVTLKLCLNTLDSWQNWLIASAAVAVVLRWKVSPAWLVLGGALIGWLLSLLQKYIT